MKKNISNLANGVKNWRYKLICFDVKQFARPVIVMMSAVVGVGFVSGAEIWSFFARFGRFCWAGIFVFAILFFCLTFKIISKNATTEKYDKLHKINKNLSKNTILTKSRAKMTLLFLSELVIASAMFSGLKELIWQLFKNNHALIFCLCVLLVFFLLLFGMSGIEKFNILTMLFVGFIVTTILIFGFGGQGVDGESLKNVATNLSKNAGDFDVIYSFKNITISIAFAVAYVFMNIVQIQPIASAYNMPFSKRKCVVFSAVMSGLMTLLIVFYVLFLHNNNFLANESMPLLAFFKNTGSDLLLALFVYGLVFGLISTLLSCLFGVKGFVAKRVGSNTWQTFVSVMLALVFSMLDFEIFVGAFYPILGVISFIIFVFL